MNWVVRLAERVTRAALPPPATPPAPAISQRAQAVIGAVRNFEAAQVDRLTAGWKSPRLSAFEEIRNALEITRARARDLAKNNEYAKKYLQMVVSNVVGSSGFTLQSLAAEAGKPDTVARNLIEAAWSKWGQNGTCEVTGCYSFADVQRLVIESWARDGESLILLEPNAKNAYGFALRIVDIDRLPVQYSQNIQNIQKVQMGVELDDLGKPVAYWLNLSSNSTYSQVPLTRVPADRVIHVFKPYRAEQVRGMPTMHAVMAGLKMLDGYEEAAIVAARVGASKMGFFTTPEGDGLSIADDQDDQGNYITDADPGTFGVLPRGAELQNWTPEYPHANYESFMKSRLRAIASGLGVTYHTLGNDLEGVSFSSIRSGTLEERDAWMVLQNWFSDAFLRPVFLQWLLYALSKQAITFPSGSALPISKLEKFSEHAWQGRRWQWVDPLKDIEAARLSIKSGIASPQMIAAQNGVDVEDVIQAIAAFEAQVAAAKVTLVDYTSSSSGSAQLSPDPGPQPPQ